MRLVKQLAEFVARISKHRDEGDYDAALAEADRAFTLVDIPREMADRVDTPTLASLLSTPDKMRIAARLFWEEGRVHEGKSDPMTAFSRYRRALELYLEAYAVEPHDDDSSAIAELARLVPAQHLDPRYRSASKDREPGDPVPSK